MNILGIQVKI